MATEHFASSFVRRKLFALYNAYETGRGRGLGFAGCAPEEWHKVGLLMIALFPVRHGIRLSYLGPNLQGDGLAETLQHHRPDVLIVSEAACRIGELSEILGGLPEPRPRLAFGEHGFDDETRRRQIDETYLGPDAASALRIVERLLGIHGDAPSD